MRSPSQATPARRDRAPHYFRGERLLGGSRPAGEIENGVGASAIALRWKAAGLGTAIQDLLGLST